MLASLAETGVAERYMLRDALSDSLRERLFAREFLPGAFLDEGALARQYGVERLPLAEALRLLARERLLLARGARNRQYCVAEYRRNDLEDILDVLGRIRCRMLLRHTGFDARQADVERLEVVAPSRYWGIAGFVVAPPFILAARSLYRQLRLAVGPALTEIENLCARACAEAMTKVVVCSDDFGSERFCEESARLFRERILDGFDDDRPARRTRHLATAAMPCPVLC
ncbi:MAG: GntR family transcriptional regulator [Zoogloeaceae bacterium]|jgi:hypothetical protein|nr:GntR family transcriptional regulator [Zoogloeaceae bacterium]